MDGWEPTEETVYEYDEQGRLVRALTVREPEWSEQDVAWMLALAEWRATRCPACGGDIRECTDPASEGRYEVPPPHRCHAATAIAAAQERYMDSQHPQALLFHVRRR